MKYIILMSFLVMSFSASAKLTCSKNGTTIIYTNGIQTNSILTPPLHHDPNYGQCLK